MFSSFKQTQNESLYFLTKVKGKFEKSSQKLGCNWNVSRGDLKKIHTMRALLKNEPGPAVREALLMYILHPRHLGRTGTKIEIGAL